MSHIHQEVEYRQEVLRAVGEVPKVLWELGLGLRLGFEGSLELGLKGWGPFGSVAGKEGQVQRI